MGQVLHGSATTTEAVRRAIQHSQESLRTLARRYGINQKTVTKWKTRTSVAIFRLVRKRRDRRCPRSRRRRSWSLSGAIRCYRWMIASRRSSRPSPILTRSSLHRCLQRHGPQLGNVDVEVTARVALELLLRRLVAFDIPAGGRLHEKATTAISRDFLLRLIAAVP